LVIGGCYRLFGKCGLRYLCIDYIKTDDFDRIRSALEPDIQELFDKARRDGDRWYWLDDNLAHEKYGVLSLHIVQYEEDDGTTYKVLFAFNSGVRGFGGGYYYTPSGRLPPGAPTYGVVCSKRVDDFWYAFLTVDSQNPPSLKSCPEDIQYHQ